jgi:hypothetical protein
MMGKLDWQDNGRLGNNGASDPAKEPRHGSARSRPMATARRLAIADGFSALPHPRLDSKNKRQLLID